MVRNKRNIGPTIYSSLAFNSTGPNKNISSTIVVVHFSCLSHFVYSQLSSFSLSFSKLPNWEKFEIPSNHPPLSLSEKSARRGSSPGDGELVPSTSPPILPQFDFCTTLSLPLSLHTLFHHLHHQTEDPSELISTQPAAAISLSLSLFSAGETLHHRRRVSRAAAVRHSPISQYHLPPNPKLGSLPQVQALPLSLTPLPHAFHLFSRSRPILSLLLSLLQIGPHLSRSSSAPTAAAATVAAPSGRRQFSPSRSSSLSPPSQPILSLFSSVLSLSISQIPHAVAVPTSRVCWPSRYATAESPPSASGLASSPAVPVYLSQFQSTADFVEQNCQQAYLAFSIIGKLGFFQKWAQKEDLAKIALIPSCT